MHRGVNATAEYMREILTDSDDESNENFSGRMSMISHSLHQPMPESALSHCMRASKEHFVNAADYVLSVLRIYFNTTALSGRVLHQLFLQLDRYGDAPSKTAQQTWLSLPIMGGNALLAIPLVVLNHQHMKKHDGKYPAFEDYVMSFLSAPAVVFFAMDAVIASGHSTTLPLGWFIAIIALGIPTTALLSVGITAPDSSNQFIASLTSLRSAVSRAHRFEKNEVTSAEQYINALNAVVKYAFASLSVLFSVINRENDGASSVPLFTWQIGLIGLYFIFAGKVGFEAMHHKRFYQAWAAFSKGLKEAALTFYTLSAMVFVAGVYQCPDRTFCLDENAKTFFNYVLFSISLAMGVYGAATTRVRFVAQHESNVGVLRAASKATRCVTTSVVSAVSFMKRLCTRCNNQDQMGVSLVTP